MSGSSYGVFLFAGAGAAAQPGLMGTVRNRLGRMLRARRTRRLLGEMDDRMLADIGIGRGEAATESSRAMWDLSTHR